MGNPKDATIDIPLHPVPSRGQTGARKMDSNISNAGPSSSPGADGASQAEKGGEFSGRRVVDKERARQAESPDDGTLTRMGKFYTKILNFSVVTRYFIYVLPLALLIAIPILIGATAAQDARIGGVRIVWFFTWVEIVWLSLWVSKVICHYIPFVFQFLCGIVSSGTRKYALILTALEIPFSLVGWSVTSLATFIPVMTRNPDQRAKGDTGIKKWEDVVKNILFAAFISSLVLAAEKILVQLISISYHRKQFDLKIQESKRHIDLIGQLYEASRKMFPEYCKEFEEEDYIINDSIMALGGKKNKRMASASPMRLIQNVGQNVGRVGDKITAAFGHVAHEITGKQVFNAAAAHSVVIMALEKRKSSEALARRLWMSFVLAGREDLYVDDLYDVFGPGHEAEAEECFAVLDVDDNGDVSLEEMILKVTEFGRARHAINKSMHDVDQAIHVLDNLLCTVVFILVILIFVAFLNKGFGTTLAAGATALLSLSFVFAATAQEVLGSCIFLFVKHPYDVGDRVDVNGSRLIVERISLLFTIFKNIDDNKITQVANIVLNTSWIENVSRSKAMKERLTLTVDFGTSFEDIQLLKNEMTKFVTDKENCRDFQRDVDVEVLGVGEMSKMELIIEIRHKSNWANETVRASRRSKFMCALVLAVRKVPIYGPGGGDAGLGDAANPTYSVAIGQEQAQANKDKFAEDKEKARMVPTGEAEKEAPPTEKDSKATGSDTTPSGSGLTYRGSTGPVNETAYAGALNARPPAMDRSQTDQSVMRHAESDENPLLRAPSTGKRFPGTAPGIVSPNTPATEIPSMSPTIRQPVEYHEYATQFNQPSGSGRESPYQTNNPYARRSPTPTQQQGLTPGYQSPPPHAPSPAASQGSIPRRPAPSPTGHSQQAPQYQPPPSSSQPPRLP